MQRNIILEKAFEAYAERIFPKNFPIDSIYKDSYESRALYNLERESFLLRVKEHFVAGYLAAFVEGNHSPISSHTVVSDIELLKLRG
jgi:hypothetical protein